MLSLERIFDLIGIVMLKKMVLWICMLFLLAVCNANPIQSISCSDDKLTISYEVPKALSLIELMPYQHYSADDDTAILSTCNGSGKLVLDRFVHGRDRLYSKYALVDMEAGKLVGDYKYVTSIKMSNQRDFKLLRPESIKGLSCIVDIDDAIELGVKYIHENVHLNQLIDIHNLDPTTYYEFDGLKIPLNMNRITALDQRLKRFSDAGIAVFVVLLNGLSPDPAKRTVLVHPKTDMAQSPNHLGGFNTMDPMGVKYFLGTLEFMTERYTRPDRKYGQISSLIIGNEIQQHWIWYNMGDIEEDAFLREYETTLRLAWLACNKCHPDLRVYVSMDHHWGRRGFKNNPLREIPGNIVLEKIAAYSKAGGDYPWNVAFHPYPENLFQPQFWHDKSPTDDFNSPLITFKNIDLLPRFMKQSHMLCNGKIRDIALTEQGFHTPDGPEGETIQAAAYAYAYYKIKQIPEISAFILHRHVDHRGEGGLRLGLWTNDPNGAMHEPLKKKKIWDVFKGADTDRWQEVFDFAKPIIAIDEWDQTPSK